MAVLFSVFVTIYGVVFIRQAKPLDRVAIQAFGSFLVGQIQSGFLHPFKTLHARRFTMFRQAIESLLPLRQLYAEVTERYLVPVDAEQSQETVLLVEPRVLEIRFLQRTHTRGRSVRRNDHSGLLLVLFYKRRRPEPTARRTRGLQEMKGFFLN